MSKITQAAGSVCAFLRGRVGARLLLILVCLVCYFVFSPYLAPVSVTADGETYSFVTFNGNDPGEIIAQAGLALDDEDKYTVDYQSTEDSGDVNVAINVLRAFDVSISDGGNTAVYTVAGGTVGDLLGEAGITAPDDDDQINCKLSDMLYAYMEIVIDRVEYRETKTNETIAYKIVKRESSELTKGTTKVVTVGENGEKSVVTGNTYVNGELAKSIVVSEKVIKEAVNEVIDVGTKVTTTTTTKAGNALSTRKTSTVNAAGGTFIDSSGRTVSYSKVLTGEGTAYTDEPTALTSTGRTVQVGVVAVDPEVIPYGTRLYIVSADGKIVYGYALAADTGSAMRSGRVLVDLFYDSESQCVAFGRRDVVVYVLS